jgi:hypothetical protein
MNATNEEKAVLRTKYAPDGKEYQSSEWMMNSIRTLIISSMNMPGQSNSAPPSLYSNKDTALTAIPIETNNLRI